MQVCYRDAVDNIIFLKSQQWRITHYGVLLYAALIAIDQIRESSQSVADCLVPVADGLVISSAGLVMVATLVQVCVAQLGLGKFRDRLAYMYDKYFEKTERDDLGLSTARKGFWFDNVVLFSQTLVLLFGFIAVMMIVISM